MNKNDILMKTAEALQAALKEARDPQTISDLSEKLLSVYDRMEKDEELWDLHRASCFLGMKPDTLRKMAAQKKIPSIQIGSLRRFDPGRLKRWALSRETQIATWHR